MCSKLIKTAIPRYPAPHRMAVVFLALFIFIANAAFAQNPATNPQQAPQNSCSATDTNCLLSDLEGIAGKISETPWRDQIYREMAKLYTASNRTKDALSLIPKIETPDTKAMTIRGIGMQAARMNLPPDELAPLFAALRAEADKITHPPSLGIALTYIAMSQAFAGDNAGAYATAKSMTNDALRHKAFGENAEIQAERGELNAVLESLAAIDSSSFRDKACNTVAEIFAGKGMFDEALTVTRMIGGNDYQKSKAILYILARQITPDEITLGIKE